MANDLQSPPEPSVSSLVSGIIDDAQELLKQQVTLFRQEILTDLKKTRDASSAVAAGAAVCIPGALAFCLMIAHLLHWLTSPAGSDPASIPLWACYAIAGALFAVVGGGLIYAGIRKFESFNPLPEQSVEALKENVQWLTNPTNPK
jgi:hypothetical protein